MKLTTAVCCTSLLIEVVGLINHMTGQEPLPFRKAIELALSNSIQLALNRTSETSAYETYKEARAAYIPKLTVGSDVGYSHGFPLSLEGSAPTLFNVTSQSSVWSPAQSSFTKAATANWRASKLQTADQRAQIILDTAVTYIELNSWESKLGILEAEVNVAGNIESTVAQRVKAGVDPEIEETKADLVDAQVGVHMTEAKGAIEVLRLQLSQLTGVPAASIRTLRSSVPGLKEEAERDITAEVLQSNPTIQAAEQSALVKELRARGEHRALYPSLDFAAQYGLVNTSLTNFEQFFVPHSFQPNNVTFGLVIRLPFLDNSQRARAAAADADALRARKEVEDTKNKAVLDAVKLRNNVDQLEATRRVADLRYKLADNQVEVAQVRMQSATGTLRERQDATINAAERTLERISADFDVERTELELLRAEGKLESWVLSKQ